MRRGRKLGLKKSSMVSVEKMRRRVREKGRGRQEPLTCRILTELSFITSSTQVVVQLS